MKSKTIWIVLGVLVLLVVIFFVWRSRQQAKADALAIQQQQNQILMTGGNTGQNQSGFTNTLDSVGGVIDSLSGLFGNLGWGGGNSAGNEQAMIEQFKNECETVYNTNEEVAACVQSKINAA